MALTAAVAATGAWAQEAPPVALPALPAADSQIEQFVPKPATSVYKVARDTGFGGFPALPAARACTKEEIPGVWILVKAVEHNTDGTSTDFMVKPNQPLVFDTSGIYVERRFNQGAIKNPSALNQYVAADGGFIYFYTNGQFTHSRVCFIVARAQDDFGVGNMLLLPPMPSDGSLPTKRLVMAYRRASPPQNQASPPPQPSFNPLPPATVGR